MNSKIQLPKPPEVEQSLIRLHGQGLSKRKMVSPALYLKTFGRGGFAAELTESEKQLDAIVHAKELEMAQKETITLANQWSAQQEQAATLAEMVAAEQAHAAEMVPQASQITLTLQSAHKRTINECSFGDDRKENEAAKIRETGAQTTGELR